MNLVVQTVFACLLLLATVQFASIAIVIWRKSRWNAHRGNDGAGVSVLRPLCGLENNLWRTLETSFNIDYPRYELIFCVASQADPVIPVIEALIASHPTMDARLLIGNERISDNPKLNNLVKGWAAAKYDWIVISDSNVLIPPDYIDSLRACWTADTAFACSPPVGIDAEGTGAELEVAFLNTYQARWQLVADAFGIGFVQGKTILLCRSELERYGGLRMLAAEAAEDAAATKIARRNAKTVKVVREPFGQPLGHRSFADVWRRQLRWAQLRRSSFPWAYSAEILTGVVPPAALYCILSGLDAAPWIGLPALPALADPLDPRLVRTWVQLARSQNDRHAAVILQTDLLKAACTFMTNTAAGVVGGSWCREAVTVDKLLRSGG